MTGKDLKFFLINRGYVLKDVADILGMTQQAFSQLLKAQDVKTGSVEKICDALKISICDLYGSGDTVIASSNSTAIKNTGTMTHEEGLIELLKKKDEQIDRLLSIIEKQKQ